MRAVHRRSRWTAVLPRLRRHARLRRLDATFYAWGPAFKKGTKLPSFENVHVYPIVTDLLGLPYEHKINGKKKIAKKLLH